MVLGVVAGLFTGLVATASPVSPAPAATSSKIYGNIREGNVGFDSGFDSLNLSSTSVEGANSVTSFNITLRTRYFLIDKLGLGVVLRLATQTGYTNLMAGPSVQYYFWTNDRLGAYFTQDLLVSNVSTSGNSNSGFRTDSIVGLNYFLHPAVAVGPAVELYHQFGNANRSRFNVFSFLAQFSVYL